MATTDFFCSLPDSVLLNILKHLPVEDLLNISNTCSRLHTLCGDRTIVRCVDVEGRYSVSEDNFKSLIQIGHRHVHQLRLDHCYWLHQRMLVWAISRCKQLRTLRLIESKIKIETLVNLIAACPLLEELAFSISSFANIKIDMFHPAKLVLKNLKRLDVYYTSREMALVNYFGEHKTLLDYCECLQELHIGSAGMAIPELYRPILSEPCRLRTLRVMSITSNIHAGAQMMFYGTLSQLPNATIAWQTLLMPNVNLQELVTKPDFCDCVANMPNIRHLDVSGSKIPFPCEGLDITTATQLVHLNISMTLVTSDQLRIVAANCNKLTSVNLFGCVYIFQHVQGLERRGLDFSGLESVFEQCTGLQELNIAGAHHHLFMLPESDQGVIRRVFSKMKGLKKLSLPMCMLAETSQSMSRSGKRQGSSPKCHTAVKRRCLETGYVSTSDGSPDLEPSSPQSSNSLTRQSGSAAASQRVLADIYLNNPDIEELELLAVNFVSAIHKNKYINPKNQQFGPCVETRRVTDLTLEPINHMKKLTTLVIVGALGLVSGKFLVNIGKECQKLQSLMLGYLGRALYGNTFSNALPHFKCLRDFRLEQPHLCLNPVLFCGLQQCHQLTRLCLLTKHSTFTSPDILRLVEQLPKLVVLQLFAGGTITNCKSLTNTLNRRFLKLRPALAVSIYPLVYDGVSEITKSIPAKHFDELTRFQSRVCFTLPSSR